MSKFEDLKKNVDEGKNPVIALKIEDGSYLYCGVKALFKMDEKDYVAFLPLEGDNPEIFFLHVKRDDEDEVDFEDIDDGDEYSKVVETYENPIKQQNKDEGKAFGGMEQKLIEECTKDPLDLDKIKMLIDNGADINACRGKWNTPLNRDVVDYYACRGEKFENRNLSNLAQVMELLIEKGMLLNPKPGDSRGFLLPALQFLPPEKICVDTYKMLLEKGNPSFEDLNYAMYCYVCNMHSTDDDYDFYSWKKPKKYKKKDCLNYFLEITYWTCAYQVKLYPEKCAKDLLGINWLDREKYTVMLKRGRQTSRVIIENNETQQSATIYSYTDD
jgi:hypothetical protein